MLEALLRPLVFWRLRGFERRYDYSMAYARDLFDASPKAFFQYAKLLDMAGFAQNCSPAMLTAVRFAATRQEDCGPCSQLMLDMGQEAGVPDAALQALIAGDERAMPDDMLLAWRYAQAALRHDADLPLLAEALRERHGPRALASLALALVSARSFPTLKYALGQGQSCQRLTLKKGMT